MNNSIEVFDTDIISEYVRNKPEAVARFNRSSPSRMFTTVVSEAELLGPRYRHLLTAADEGDLTEAQRRLNIIHDVLTNSFAGIFPMDLVAARRYAELKHVQKLAKIENADLLIAAIALRHRATLVTGNADHFRKVPGLNVDDFRQR